MTFPIYYLPLFYFCVFVGFMAILFEPMKPAYHWKEIT